MVLGIICLLGVLGVAYFHWVQGLFSAIISMAFAILASALALGYHEFVVASILGGKMADMANGMVICAIFAAVYGIGRVVFDSLIPGNVRVPLYVDKVGGALCGLIAGAFAVGTVAIAVQTFPFGPSFAFGFARYPIAESRDVSVPGKGREQDATISDALDLDPGTAIPSESKRQGMFGFQADQFVLDYFTKQSADGALATTGTPFGAVHPDLLREVFFQRVGVEPGAKHVAMNIGGKNEVTVANVFEPRTLRAMDAEIKGVRDGQGGFLVKADPKQPQASASGGNTSTSPIGTLESTKERPLIVVRTTVKLDAAEKDGKLRFSMGTARLVSGGKEYYPVGTLDVSGGIALLSRIDDYLAADKTGGSGNEATIDFVYQLDSAALSADGEKLKPGSFFELKRYGRAELADKEIAKGPVPAQVKLNADDKSGGGGVMRKELVKRALSPNPNP